MELRSKPGAPAIDGFIKIVAGDETAAPAA